MYKGMYIAASGALLKQKQMDIISNNLANANTTGYKKDDIAFKELLVSSMSGIVQDRDEILRSSEQLRSTGNRADMVATGYIYTDFEGGGVVQTGNPLNAVIEGEGFFAVEGEEGNLYTRSGSFTVDSEGYLALPDGRRVLGTGGAIKVDEGKVEINVSGEVSVDGEVSDQLLIVNFEDKTKVYKHESSYFTTEEEPQVATASVRQGYLEGSNVNVVDEMVTMIEAVREFESFQKVVQAFDELSSKVVNEMAKF